MDIGHLSIALALPAAIFSIVSSVFGDSLSVSRAKNSAHLVTLLVTLASVMLIFAFVNDSFNIKYVYEYSSRALPLPYKLSGIWAGLDGSLLFWVWILALCTSLVLALNPGGANSSRRILVVNAILQTIAAFFLVMLVFAADPFATLSGTVADGRGLNPLLQNFFMVIHPPLLYFGYVGFSVPFAFVIADLILKKDPPDKLKELRIWMILPWLFLTAGNFLGAMWAYLELGWGGFWAWDPVENAGILPWFTACAFLHSIMMEERRGMFKAWNRLLVISTFLLTIFGTFITRSGIIRSVHSFSDVTIGIYFFTFLVLATAYSLYLVASRKKDFRGVSKQCKIVSRESAFYLNNYLLIFALVAILWGTLFPLFVEIFTGTKLEVGPSFFNRLVGPIGIALLFLTGICPEMSWRHWRPRIFRKSFLIAALLAMHAGMPLFYLGVRKWFPFLASIGAVFTLTATICDFFRSALVVRKRLRLGFARAVFATYRVMPRRIGGYIVHIGIVFLFIGIAGSSYQQEHRFTLKKGAAESVAGYELRLNDIRWTNNKDVEGVLAALTVSEGGKKIGNLKPALMLHKNQPKPIAEVDLIIEPLKDIYLAMGGVSGEEEEASFALTITPLISAVWLGGIIMFIGTVLALVPFRRRRGGPEESDENLIDIALDRAQKEDFE